MSGIDRRQVALVFAAIFLALAPGSRAAPPLSLFDGPDLSAWIEVPAPPDGDAGIWSIHDGIVRCLGTPKGYLRTRQSYRNYRLRIQWRWPGKPGNSGVFVHGSGPDQVWPHCYEAQLLAGNAGEIRSNGGSKFHEHSVPTDRSIPKLAPSSERPPGEWNDYEITCLGATVELKVNGVLQNRLQNAVLRSGWIGLQSEGGIIEFRALTVEALAGPASDSGRP